MRANERTDKRIVASRPFAFPYINRLRMTIYENLLRFPYFGEGKYRGFVDEERGNQGDVRMDSFKEVVSRLFQ